MHLSSESTRPALPSSVRRRYAHRPVPKAPPLELDLLLERWRLADEHARCYVSYLRGTVRSHWSDEQLQCLAGLRQQETRALAQVMAHLRLVGLCDVPESSLD